MADEDVKPLSESRRLDEDLSWHVRTDELKQIRIDRVSDQLVFIGRAVSQAALTSEAQWQIQRITFQSSGDEVKEFAVKGAYTQVWDDRASLFPAFTPGTGVINPQIVVGNVADDDPDLGNPVKIGSRTVDEDSVLSSVSVFGDRADLISDIYRRKHNNNSLIVGSKSYNFDATIISAEVIDTSRLSGRTKMIIQNNGNRSVHIRLDAGAGTAVITDEEIEAGDTWEEFVSPALGVFVIAINGTQTLRVRESG